MYKDTLLKPAYKRAEKTLKQYSEPKITRKIKRKSIKLIKKEIKRIAKLIDESNKAYGPIAIRPNFSKGLK